MTVEQVLAKLRKLADPEKIAFKKKKFGVVSQNALGVYHKDLKVLAKEYGHQKELGLALYDTGIYEGKLLCSKLLRPKDVTKELAEKWVKDFDNWEICDSFCMGLVAKSSLALDRIQEWTGRKKEFEKRAAFATMAAYCMADKKAANSVYEAFLPIIKKAATDNRLYVKKAVNWALRSIGKRNIDLNKKAIKTANEILKIEDKAAQWIAKDALRELEKEGVNILDYPRAIYRKD
ncbi:MAG: DNA alkylation repair protein [Aureispira sp.]|nr:DNA alkylation repair protein [Aureispira sp.]